MNGLISLIGVLVLLLALGGVVGCIDRRRFAPHWLLVGALLVAINDLLLTRVYGLLPDLIGGTWNWEGKFLALLATLVIAATPAFGWRRIFLTLSQEPGSIKAALPVAMLYCSFFLIVAMAFPGSQFNAEEIAFQLTMPGLEEESFYRGVLLFALNRAFLGRVRFLGVDWGWGAVLSCFLFGMGHAFNFSQGSFHFDPITFAFTAVPSIIAVWLCLRTRSLLLPVTVHNFGNSIMLLA